MIQHHSPCCFISILKGWLLNFNVMAKKKKMPKYQFGVGRRTIHIEAKDLKSAKKKAEKWRNKNAKNSTLAYDYRID